MSSNRGSVAARAGELAQQPQLLVVRDVREVPARAATSASDTCGAGRCRRSARAGRGSARGRVGAPRRRRPAAPWCRVAVMKVRSDRSRGRVERAVTVPRVEQVVGRLRPRSTNRSANAATASAVAALGAGSRERVERGGEALAGRVGQRRDATRPSRCRVFPQAGGVDRLRPRLTSAASGSFDQHRRDRGRDAPPRARERVDHAQLEPASWPHRREQRA